MSNKTKEMNFYPQGPDISKLPWQQILFPSMPVSELQSKSIYIIFLLYRSLLMMLHHLFDNFFPKAEIKEHLVLK